MRSGCSKTPCCEAVIGPSENAPSTRWRRLSRHVPLLLIVALGALLIFPKLGNIYLWQDEAQTALLAKVVLSRGLPYAYDGKNWMFQDGEAAHASKDFVWKWHPWLQFYIAAPSLALFGATAFAARLPFAILGLASVILAYFAGLQFWRTRAAGVVSAVLLVTSVPFLILVRQARYYSPTIFFALLALYAYHRLTEGKRYSALLFVLACLMLVHSQYAFLVVVLLTTSIHLLLLRRDRMKPYLWALVAALVLCAPWVIYFADIKRPEVYSQQGSLTFLFNSISFYAHTIRRYVLGPWFALLVIAGFFYQRRVQRRGDGDPLGPTVLLASFLVVSVLVLSAGAPSLFVRALAPLIPIACLLVAGAVHRLPAKAVGVVLLMTIVGSSLRGMLDARHVPNHLGTHIYELTHDYDGPIEGIVKYLGAHAGANDVVLMTYGDLPVKFYTDLRVLGGLTGEDLSPAEKADWVIVRHATVSDFERPVRRFIENRLGIGAGLHIRMDSEVPCYQKIGLSYPDIPWENREDPYLHRSRTVVGTRPVVLYKRRPGDCEARPAGDSEVNQ